MTDDTPQREFQRIDLADLQHEKTRQLLQYWRDRCTSERLPARTDVDPIEMDFILGNVVLIDVLRDPLRFRYRLIGANLTEHVGFDPTGLMIDQHPDRTFQEMVVTVLTEMVESGEPMAIRLDDLVDARDRKFEAVLLPLATDGRTVDMVLAGQCLL